MQHGKDEWLHQGEAIFEKVWWNCIRGKGNMMEQWRLEARIGKKNGADDFMRLNGRMND